MPSKKDDTRVCGIRLPKELWPRFIIQFNKFSAKRGIYKITANSFAVSLIEIGLETLESNKNGK